MTACLEYPPTTTPQKMFEQRAEWIATKSCKPAFAILDTGNGLISLDSDSDSQLTSTVLRWDHLRRKNRTCRDTMLALKLKLSDRTLAFSD